jgi:hypothetical protein
MSRESVVVSVQTSSAVDVLSGHLAWGALLDHDVVVVPPPLTWLDGDDRFEVLVASGDRRLPVQRFSPRSVLVLAPDAEPDGGIALVRLNGSSDASPVGDCFDVDRLAVLLNAGGSVWPALEKAGVVPPGLVDAPVQELLGPIVEREHRQRDKLVSRAPLGLASPQWLCWLSPRCHCV